MTPLESVKAAKRERHYRELLNALPVAIYTTDAEGHITFYNEAAVAFSGRRPVLGADKWCVTWRLYETDGTPLPHDKCPMAVALKEGREVRGAEAVAERPDGSRVSFTPYPTPLWDETGALIGAVNMLVDITHRKEAEQRQSLLTHEVNHRANNLLGIVQATLHLTQADTVEAFRDTVEGRLMALAHTHNLLAKSGWGSADLHRLVSEELAPFLGGPSARVWISGPHLALEPKAAQCMAMIIHELATNAARHGALSGPRGRVLIEWNDAAGGELSVSWTELGGPPASPPRRERVGAQVIRGAAKQLHGRVEFDWRAAGLFCNIRAPIKGPATARLNRMAGPLARRVRKA